MSIYDKPTKTLMGEFAKENLSSGQVFTKRDAVAWFTKHYPDIKSTTVQAHVEAMAVNSRSRKHHPNVKRGSGHDLFFKVGPARYRLWNPEADPRPVYSNDMSSLEGESRETISELEAEENEEISAESGSQEFAYERDLRNYLSKNLGSLETGLRLYQDEDLTGVEFPVGGRYIDILGVDANEDFVVIELKVSRGYDRTVGQILRYMAWVEKNLAEKKRVRGIIVANEISGDLKLAASRIPDIQLAEYEISFHMKAVK